MHDFLKFFDHCLSIAPHLCLDIGYNSYTDWTIAIHDKTGKRMQNSDLIVLVQNPDKNYAFATAYINLAEWMCENKGSY